MKKIIIITFSIFLGCKNNNEAIITPTFGILIHGGAGTILKKNMSSAKDTEYRNILKEAIEAFLNPTTKMQKSTEVKEQVFKYEENPIKIIKSVTT